MATKRRLSNGMYSTKPLDQDGFHDEYYGATGVAKLDPASYDPSNDLDYQNPPTAQGPVAVDSYYAAALTTLNQGVTTNGTLLANYQSQAAGYQATSDASQASISACNRQNIFNKCKAGTIASYQNNYKQAQQSLTNVDNIMNQITGFLQAADTIKQQIITLRASNQNTVGFKNASVAAGYTPAPNAEPSSTLPPQVTAAIATAQNKMSLPVKIGLVVVGLAVVGLILRGLFHHSK